MIGFHSRQDLNGNTVAISVSWSINDIQERTEALNVALTDAQKGKVLDPLLDNHDANEGINWERVDYYISVVLKEEKSNE